MGGLYFKSVTVLPLSSSVKKKDADLVATMSRASDLQDQLNKSEAALCTALSQNAALTSELADVNSLLAKVCMSIVPFCLRIKKNILLGVAQIIQILV